MLLLLAWLLGSVPVALVLGRAMAYDARPTQPQPVLERRREPAAA